MSYVLAIDQGTHASRAQLFDPTGTVITESLQEIALNRISDDTVEQDPLQILNSVRSVVNEAVRKSRVPIDMASLATQRSTLVAWDRISGQALAPAISWQDRRSAPIVQKFMAHGRHVHAITGLPLSPHYLAGKILWLLENNQSVQKALGTGSLLMGPLASFLAFHLLEENPVLVDHSNAARSLLFDLTRLGWSKRLLHLFNIPDTILPPCRPTLADHGIMKRYRFPLRCLCGDQNAAAYFCGLPRTDTAIINVGTGAFILRTTGPRPIFQPRLLTSLGSSTAGQADYLLEGTVNGAGSALTGMPELLSRADLARKLPDWLRQASNIPTFINGIGGLGSPWWRDHFPSEFIPEPAGPADKAAAVIESVIFLLQHNLAQCQQIPAGLPPLSRIYTGGGLSRLDGFCQRLADVSHLEVDRFDTREATTRGAAWLAAGKSALWRLPVIQSRFQPHSNPQLEQRFRLFTELLKARLD